MTVLRLQYVPIIESLHVYLNGTEVHRDHFTYNAGNNTVKLVSADELSGDRLEARYAYLDTAVPAPTSGTYITQAGSTGNVPPSAEIPVPAHNAGDLIIAAIVASGGTMSIPQGWTQIVSDLTQCTDDGCLNLGGHVLMKVGVGSGTQISEEVNLGTGANASHSASAWWATRTVVYRGASFIGVNTARNDTRTLVNTTPGFANSGTAVHIMFGKTYTGSWSAGVTSRVAVNTSRGDAILIADATLDGSPATFTASSTVGQTISATIGLIGS